MENNIVSSIQRIDVLTKKLLKKTRVKSQSKLAESFSKIWNTMLDKNILEYTHIGAVRKGVVYIYVESPLVLQELNMCNKEKLLKKLQEKVPGLIDIKFKLK